MNEHDNIVASLLRAISKICSDNTDKTIFDMIGSRSRETMHSAIISFLLNPNAHQGGTECLKEFVKLFPDNSLGRFNPENVVEVQVEKDLGPVIIDEHPTGGRIDIYIEDGDGNVLVIENKIYAGDSECQLLRYHNSLTDTNKPHSLIYLSLNGNKPSDWSLGTKKDIKSPLEADSVNVLSYSTIHQWLSRIEDYCSQEMKSNISQYSRLLSNLLIENQIQEEIRSSGNSFRAAIEIAKNLENARMNLKREFVDLLKISLNVILKREENYLIEDYSNPHNAKLVGVSIYSERSRLRFDIVIDWRLYIQCNRSFPDILVHDSWDYIGGKDIWNFHDCSEMVVKYLSSSKKDRQSLVYGVARQNVEIIYKIEKKNNQ